MASSNIMYPMLAVVNIINVGRDLNTAPAQYSLISVSTMCPAVMFAASRNDSVIGRTRILVVSIMTRNGFSHSGAPSGRKWAVDFFGEYLNVEINILNHIGNPINRVMIRCLDEDIEYGIIPIILIVMIIINSLATVEESPLMLIAVVRNICVIIKFVIGMNILLFRCDVFHIPD